MTFCFPFQFSFKLSLKHVCWFFNHFIIWKFLIFEFLLSVVVFYVCVVFVRGDIRKGHKKYCAIETQQSVD